MISENIIQGNNEEEIWQQITSYLQQDRDLLEYNATIIQQGKRISLDIDIDLGGGFESGFQSTMLTATVLVNHDFKFAIHKEHFTDEIGKFFGMQDVEIGYKDFDDKLIIKTNNKEAVNQLFADETIRQTLLDLADFTFGTTHRTTEGIEATHLELYIENAVTDPIELRKIYSAFVLVLNNIEEMAL